MHIGNSLESGAHHASFLRCIFYCLLFILAVPRVYAIKDLLVIHEEYN